MVNFRKNLIQKCLPTDGTVADTESLSEVLHHSPEADNSRLVAYAWQHVIPAGERLTVYKQLLGITGAYPETKDIIAKHRRDEAYVLLNGLIGLRQFSGTLTDGEYKPRTTDIMKMVLIALNLYNRNIDYESLEKLSKISMHASFHEIEKRERELAAVAIVKQVTHLCPENWIDAFHIARGIFRIIDQNFVRDGAVDQYATEIRLTLINNHGLKTLKTDPSDMRVYIRSCMAENVTCQRTMFLIFDKIVTGQSIGTLLRSFAVALLLSFEVRETDSAAQQRCATQAIEEAWRAMRSGGAGSSNRPSWPRELPRPVINRHSYSLGEAR